MNASRLFVIGFALACLLWPATKGRAQQRPSPTPDTGQVVVDRARLGGADALELRMYAGRLIVRGTTGNRIAYSIRQILTVPGGRRPVADTLPAAASDSALYGNWFFDMAKDSTGARGTGFVNRYPTPRLELNGMTLDLSGIVGYWIHLAESSSLKWTPLGSGLPSVLADSGIEVILEVPRDLRRLRIEMVRFGGIAVQDFDGDLVITSAGGPVHLGRIGGSALVEAAGDVTATLVRPRAKAEVSILSAWGTATVWIGGDFGGDWKFQGLPTVRGSMATDPSDRRVVTLSSPRALNVRHSFGSIYLQAVQGGTRVEFRPFELPRWPKGPP